MTFEELMHEIDQLENPYSEEWWPQVAAHVKIFNDETDDEGRAQVKAWLEGIEEEAKGIDIPDV